MRILISGGAGFLGSHLCERLLAERHSIICLDNLKTGTGDNIAHLFSEPGFEFLRHDISQPLQVKGELDYVLHFASLASPKDYQRDPIPTLKVGALGTHHLLGVAKAAGARFLLASTSEVYGDPEVSPQPEGYWGHVNTLGPRSCYDESKRFAEAITMAYCRTHQVDVRIVRIFNTYGPRMRWDDGRVIPAFIMQALHNEPLTVYGKGSQTRSFCYVDDLIEGIVRLMYWNPDPEVGCDGRVFNLGNPEEITVLEMAREVVKSTRSKSPIVFCPLPEDDPQRRCPDITRARSVLGWTPRVSRAEGVRKTVAYFRQVSQSGKGNTLTQARNSSTDPELVRGLEVVAQSTREDQ